MIQQKRYPNLKAFTANEQHLFFGREREKEELHQLVVLHNIVVLFGKSGTGKTSLLQAGVVPQLEHRLLQPVFLRLNRSNAQQQLLPPEQQVLEILRDGKYLPKSTPDGLTLWEYLKLFRYTSAGERYTPLLIFDQFEELFTLYTPEQRANFVAQFADLLNGTMPAHLRQALEAELPTLTPQQIANRTESPQIKIVVSLRSDFLYLLDQLSAAIPAILRCRYELLSMLPTEAQKAIVQPAQTEGNHYISPPFVYSPNALQQILDYLGKDKNEQGSTNTQNRDIESFQIQMVCSNIEDKVIKQYPQNLPINTMPTVATGHNLPLPPQQPITTITPEFYGDEAGLKKIIDDFYADLLHDARTQFGNDACTKLQNAIERGLMRNERRLSTDAQLLQQDYGITDKQLQWLESRYLLRKEPRMGSNYYEITHDTLLAPISANDKLRREAEEKLRLAEEKEAAERKAKAIAEQAERDRYLRVRANRFAMAALVVALLAVGAGGYAYVQKVKADEQTQIAEQKQQEAEDNLRKFKEEETKNKTLKVKELRDKITRAQKANEKQYVCDLWKEILSIDPNDQEAQQQTKLCK